MASDRTFTQIERDRSFFRSAGVKEFVGFQDIGEANRAEEHCPGQRCSEAYLRLRRLWNGQSDKQFAIHGRAPLLEPPKAAADRVAHWLSTKRRHPERALVAVCPFSNHSSKDISQGTAVELVKRLESEAGLEVAIVGGAKDASAAGLIIDQSGTGLNGCGIFSIAETAALMTKCDLAVTVDSGPMHLAAAVGTPTVVVYSRTNAHFDRWFPLGTRHTILYRVRLIARDVESRYASFGSPPASAAFLLTRFWWRHRTPFAVRL